MDHEVKGSEITNRALTRLPQHGTLPVVRLGFWSGLTVCGFFGHFRWRVSRKSGVTLRKEHDPEKGWKQERESVGHV